MTESLSARLLEIAPSLYSQDDAIASKARELVSVARTIQNREEQLLQLRESVTVCLSKGKRGGKGRGVGRGVGRGEGRGGKMVGRREEVALAPMLMSLLLVAPPSISPSTSVRLCTKSTFPLSVSSTRTLSSPPVLWSWLCVVPVPRTGRAWAYNSTNQDSSHRM